MDAFESDDEDEEAQEQAALKIQSVLRGKNARQQAKNKTKAAVKIQSAHRGKRDRQKAAKKNFQQRIKKDSAGDAAIEMDGSSAAASGTGSGGGKGALSGAGSGTGAGGVIDSGFTNTQVWFHSVFLIAVLHYLTLRITHCADCGSLMLSHCRLLHVSFQRLKLRMQGASAFFTSSKSADPEEELTRAETKRLKKEGQKAQQRSEDIRK